MIEFKNVSFQYGQGTAQGRIENINLNIKNGEVVLICGESGCGKTTITRLINGLIPHYYEGELEGEVIVEGIHVKEGSLYDLSGIVGSVFQNPRTQFFTVDTTSEIAFGCENLAMDAEKIEQRIFTTTEELKIQKLLGRSLFALSGGEKQKIACASVSAMEPEIFVLDEPSSNLDVATIDDLKQVIAKWKSKGKTVVIAEHRLYYLMEIADRIIYLKDGHIEQDMSVSEFKKTEKKELEAMGLRSLYPTAFQQDWNKMKETNMIELKDFYFRYGKQEVLNIPKVAVPKGAIIGVLGNNGAGKTTLAKCLCGLEKKAKGIICTDGISYDAKKRLKNCYMVMQDVNHQLFTESVMDEILLSMPRADERKEQKKAEEILDSLNLLEMKESHPMSLSGGQKQRVAIGSAIASAKEIMVFDEPTSGLDYHHMLEVASNLRQLSAMGKTLFIITHDPELIAECCNYFIFMKDGQIAWSDGWNSMSCNRMKEFFSVMEE